MPRKNDDIREEMRNWELQQKQKGQQEIRDKIESMNDKYRQLKSDYKNFNFNNSTEDKNPPYNNSSEQADKNSYMLYELNNTFSNKDDKESKK